MVDLNAPVWREVSSAGNDADKWLRRLLSGEEEFREGMAIVAEDLSHQLSWYSATSYALPHLAALCGRLSYADQAFLTGQMGAAIAAEADASLPPDSEERREFQEGLEGLRPVVRALIRDHMDVLKTLSEEERQMFALGALAVLGDRKHAYGVYLLSAYCWEEGHAACACGWNEECFDLNGDGYLEPAAIAPWDEKSLEDEAVWLKGLLSLLGDTELLPVLPLLYGTGTCPDCGKQESYWAWLERFMEDY